jgi:hypothetical protein
VEEMGRACRMQRKMRNTFKIVVRKPEWKRLLRIWEDNIRMDLKEGGCVLDSAGSELGPLVGSCEHADEALDSIKDGEFLV